MEFPLRALARKIYFYLKLGGVDAPGTRQNTKKSKFLQLKSLFYSDNNITAR